MSGNRKDEVSKDLEAELLLAIRPEKPEAALAARLNRRLLERVRGPSADGTFTLPAQAGEWITIAPKAEMKLLREDATSRSFLLRLHPGAVLPPHDHPLEEECLVLEGEVRIGEIIVRTGDYHRAPKGVPHGEVRSRKGALLFLRGANPDHAV